MAINYLILLSRQGKVRLAKWFTTLSPKDKAKIIKDVSQLVLSRRTRMCNFLEYKGKHLPSPSFLSQYLTSCPRLDTKVVYRRYASLFFIAGCSSTDNELITLEIVHRYVEQMDKYYGNVCELDIIFNFQKAYFILDELLLAGEMQESSKKNVLRCISQQDSLEDMEYLPLREIDDVTNALNFDTTDCHVIGGCDLYTTKAAGADKKLYKNIEHSLESQYASLLSFSAGLSAQQAKAAGQSLNLSRASPFGPLSQISSRRTFAYLIATLNASHPDYDFSHLLRPSDFKREKNIRKAMNALDTTLYNLRPKFSSALIDEKPHWSNAVPTTVPQTPHGSEKWNPRMWSLIDKEMTLKDCSMYRYAPEEDPYDGEEGSLWSFNYFFFNKAKKRVCYIYLRGLSIIGNSPPQKTPIKIKRPASGISTLDEETSRKRARYWLGDRAGDAEWNTEEDDDVSGQWDEENIEESDILDDGDEPRFVPSDTDTGNESPCRGRGRSGSSGRGVSEEVAASIEI